MALKHAKVGEGADITDAQVKGFKATLWARQNAGNLTNSQIAAVKTMHRIRAKDLSFEQRQQLKDIVEESAPNRFK